ncbi:hypothetical protein [Streptomyces colonosanans]|uniref:Uncharacterized protein n=1 Tax=Streptomyces colonosanans TaxID=1428652 RepID=A0A1S2PGZ6_9ACTN|nr:hypothetical protein [Streptomyces colonosanans]OIJ92665.1 hypothetical protein BIV24_13025 [Streptomyces colonosanans]
MAAMTDVLIPALEDAREAHAAVVDRFRADATITPPGIQRQRLERQVAEAQNHLERIEDRVREIRPARGLLSTAARWTRLVTRGAVRTAVLPLQVGVRVVTETARGRQPADERRLLKNTEDAYAAAARALATCQAGKNIAEQFHDQETADLLVVLRRQDEQILETLEENLAQRARAVAAASDGRRPSPRAAADVRRLLNAVIRRMRAAGLRLRIAFRRSTRRARHKAGSTLREVPAVTHLAEKVHGAVARDNDLPIPGFSQLGITEIQQRLRGVSQTELTVIEGYERAHAGRPGVLQAIEHLREAEPWAGYDTMGPERVKTHLRNVSDRVVRQVLEYERHHRQRDTVINAAESALRPVSP